MQEQQSRRQWAQMSAFACTFLQMVRTDVGGCRLQTTGGGTPSITPWWHQRRERRRVTLPAKAEFQLAKSTPVVQGVGPRWPSEFWL